MIICSTSPPQQHLEVTLHYGRTSKIHQPLLYCNPKYSPSKWDKQNEKERRKKEKNMSCGARHELVKGQPLSREAHIAAHIYVHAPRTLGPCRVVVHTNGRGARKPCAFTNFWRHVHSHRASRAAAHTRDRLCPCTHAFVY